MSYLYAMFTIFLCSLGMYLLMEVMTPWAEFVMTQFGYGFKGWFIFMSPLFTILVLVFGYVSREDFK